MLNFSMKTLGLSLILATLCNTQALASPVFFVFKHIPAKTGEPVSGGATLRFYAKSPGLIYHSAESSHDLRLNEVDQDHMRDSWAIYYYELTLTCINSKDSRDSIRISMEVKIDNPGSYREIDISASCPVDEHGKLLLPADLTIVNK